MVKAKKYIAPLETGMQRQAIKSNADFVVLTGAGGGGKSMALGYKPFSYLYTNPHAKIIWFMRNISDFFDSGKVTDTLKEIYPLVDRRFKIQPKCPVGELIVKQEDMGIRFYNGSTIKYQQLDNERPEVLDKIFKGIQVKKAIFDECNKFQWATISKFQTRLRETGKDGKAQIILAQNPERECFIRKLCGCGANGGGWIGDDGKPIPEMNGQVRFFHMVKGNIEECYWGKSKLEVYQKAKDRIDECLRRDPDMDWQDFIQSMAFFTFDLRDNKKMLSSNKSYRAMLATSIDADSMYDCNWNYSILDNRDEEQFRRDEELSVSIDDINMMFITEPHRNDKRRITIDPASTGTDNMVMIYWEGFHAVDIEYYMKSGKIECVRRLKDFADKHGCDESELVIDCTGVFGFLQDVFPRAFHFIGNNKPSMKGRKRYVYRKDESAALAAMMIADRQITFNRDLASMRYTHQKNKTRSENLLQHLIFESSIFKFNKVQGGKIKVMDKETEQHRTLKGQSPDVTDNIIMLCGALCYDCYTILSRLNKRQYIEISSNRKEADIIIEQSEKYDNTKEVKKITQISNIINKLYGW